MKHFGKVSIPLAIGLLVVGLLGGALLGGCRPKDTDDATGNGQSDDAGKPVTFLGSKLVFPEELHVVDESINTFLNRAFEVCLSGDYEAFRLLWSAREEPLPRREFERGWVAVEEIRVRALEEVALVDDGAGTGTGTGTDRPEIVYVVYAEVELDPEKNIGNTEPLRQAVLMLVKELDQWRLANAPKKLRNWIREKVDGIAESSADSPAGEPIDQP